MDSRWTLVLAADCLYKKMFQQLGNFLGGWGCLPPWALTLEAVVSTVLTFRVIIFIDKPFLINRLRCSYFHMRLDYIIICRLKANAPRCRRWIFFALSRWTFLWIGLAADCPQHYLFGCSSNSRSLVWTTLFNPGKERYRQPWCCLHRSRLGNKRWRLP